MNLTTKKLGDMLRQLVKIRTYPGCVTRSRCKMLERAGLVSSENATKMTRYHDAKMRGMRLTPEGEKLADMLIAEFGEQIGAGQDG